MLLFSKHQVNGSDPAVDVEGYCIAVDALVVGHAPTGRG